MRFRSKIIIANLLVLFVIATTGAAAQALKKGLDFYDAKMYETAKVYLLNEVKQNPSPEAYYYLGNTYLMMEKVDSASYYYEKSKEADPEYIFATIGEAKVKLKNKEYNEAASILSSLTKEKKNRRNAEMFAAIASAYVGDGDYAKAQEMIDATLAAKRNYVDAFMISGDMYMKQGMHSKALEMYGQALYFDPQNKGAMLRTGRAYLHANKEHSLKIFKDIITQDPSYAPVYMELADFNFRGGNLAEAVEAYSYLEDVPAISTADRINYASALYFIGDYKKSLEKVEEVIAKEPDNFIMKRFLVYNNFSLDNTELAYKQAQDFFASDTDEANFVVFDHVIYGLLANENEDYPTAIEMFTKAAQMDESRVDLYEEIIAIYDKEGDYDNAMKAIVEYLEMPNNKTDAVDYYTYGQICYKAATKASQAEDTETQISCLKEAEKYYDKVIELNADHFMGYQGKARALFAQDPELEKGLAKPVYEIMIEKVMETDDPQALKSVLIEGYQYLVNYYYINDQMTQVKHYAEKILEVDPGNKQAESIIQMVK